MNIVDGAQDGSCGLTGDTAGFQNERTARPVDFDTLDVKHGSFLFMRRTDAKASHGQDGKRLSLTRVTRKRLAILPALAVLAACGPDEPKQADLSFLDDLELAVSAPEFSW